MRTDERRQSRRWWRAIEWTLLAIGVACLGQYIRLSHQLTRIEAENRAAVSRMLAERSVVAPAAVDTAVVSPEPSLPDDPSLIGELDIPRLGVSAAVRNGDDSTVLEGAVGLLPDTALPWEAGNAALAAHRDRLFRPLAGIRAGDEIRLSTGHGDFQYRVNRTFVVNPEDVWVLNSAPGVDLTLITCYPFFYVGHAPQRFVVRARKIVSRAD